MVGTCEHFTPTQYWTLQDYYLNNTTRPSSQCVGTVCIKSVQDRVVLLLDYYTKAWQSVLGDLLDSTGLLLELYKKLQRSVDSLF